MMRPLSLRRVIPLLIIITLFYYYIGSVSSKAKNLPEYKNNLVDIYANLQKVESSFRSWLSNNVDEAVVPSVSAGIVMNNKLIIHGDYSANTNTDFGIASLTKTFTAILILQLVEQGVLDLDVPLKKYLPGVVIEREGNIPVTIRHLLSHSAGIGGGEYHSVNIKGKYISYSKQVRPAGERYIYSNSGYVLLKDLLEVVTATSYAKLLEVRIFNPLGMSSSTGKYSNGTGGIRTNLKDLVKYTTMLINKGRYKDGWILNEESFREMLTPVVNIPWGGDDYSCALSWEVTRVNGRIESFYKAGRWVNSASVVQVFPDRKAALIFLCNPPNFASSSFFSWRSKILWKLKSCMEDITLDPMLFGKTNDKLLENSFIGSRLENKNGRTKQLRASDIILPNALFGFANNMDVIKSSPFLFPVIPVDKPQ